MTAAMYWFLWCVNMNEKFVLESNKYIDGMLVIRIS